MRRLLVAIVALGFSLPEPASAVATRVTPRASATASAARWRRMVEIRYRWGRTETAVVEWFGLGDSVSAGAWYFNAFTNRPILPSDMIGATVTFLGEAYPVR